MKAVINEHQLHHIFAFIERSHRIYGTKRENGRVSFGELLTPWPIVIPTPKSTIPFKKILWANGTPVPSVENDSKSNDINLTQPLLEKERRQFDTLGVIMLLLYRTKRGTILDCKRNQIFN